MTALAALNAATGFAVDPPSYGYRTRTSREIPARLGAPPAAASLNVPMDKQLYTPQVRQLLSELPPACVQSWSAPPTHVDLSIFSTASAGLPPTRHAPPPRMSNPIEAAPAVEELNLKPESANTSETNSDLLSVPNSAESLAAPSEPAIDPLSSMGPNPASDPLSNLGPDDRSRDARPAPSPPTDTSNASIVKSAYDPHAEAFAESMYPSAASCAKCHPHHYEQWRGSAHAYSSVSPMFHRFEQRLTELSQGTLGYFCMRCHAPVATQLSVSRDVSVLDAPLVMREGITCVACHRVQEFIGKSNGERRIEPGDIYQPVTADSDGQGNAEAIANRKSLKLKLSGQEPGPGQSIHNGVIRFETMSRSEYCAPCHQVAVHPNVALEVVWAQYRAGPACAKGQTCQDCHMGQVPGKALGYECRTIAELGNKPWGQPKQFSNHSFWGPGVSLAHPGVFPQNAKADRWTARQWLLFDWRGGWGTDAFEKELASLPVKPPFPAPWDEADERRDARRVLEQNLKRLEQKRESSIQTMETAIEITGPLWDAQPRAHAPFDFRYRVSNLSEGHNLPTGSLGAQPQLWLNVVLIDPQGCRVWESGDLDANGDLRDLHSELVRQDKTPLDLQLFNLQTKFLFTNLKGTDREAYLPVNFDVDQIPFLRPAAIPVSVQNHPPLIRMEAHSIPPLGQRVAKYRIPGDRLQQPGVYRLTVRMRSRMEPPYFMRFVKATPEMIQQLNEQILDIKTQSFSFEVAGY